MSQDIPLRETIILSQALPFSTANSERLAYVPVNSSLAQSTHYLGWNHSTGHCHTFTHLQEISKTSVEQTATQAKLWEVVHMC